MRKIAASAPDPAVISKLEEALASFRAHPRYALLQSVKLGGLIGRRAFATKMLNDRTLGEICELGARELSVQKGMGKAKIKLLLEVIQKLTLQERVPAPPSPKEPVGRLEHGLSEISLSEGEVKLKSLIETLRTSPLLRAYGARRLGDFWREEWPKSPFEEELTLRQISALSADQLVKKRSFSGRKAAALIGALESFLADPGRESQGGQGREGSPPAGDRAAGKELSWKDELSGLPAVLRSSVLYFASEGLKAPPSAGQLARLLSLLPRIISGRDFALLIVSVEHCSERSADLVGMNEAEYSRMRRFSEARLHEGLKQEVPQLYAHWQSALALPAVHFDALVASHLDPQVDGEVQRTLAKLALSSMGASGVQVAGRPLEGYWSADPRRAELLFSCLLGMLPKAQEDLVRTVQVLFPFVRFDDLKPSLLSRASLSKRELKWSLRPASK